MNIFKSEKGFSLLEVIVSLWIFFTISISMLFVVQLGLKAAKAITCKTSATNRAQEAIEELKSWDYSNITEANLVTRGMQNEIVYLTKGRSLQGNLCATRHIYVEENAEQDQKLIIVEVKWNERSIEKTATLTTYIYKD
ncbi:MAG: hypothetical protein ABIB46_06900 [bacterium]